MNGITIRWVVVLGFLLSLMAWGYHRLDAAKADVATITAIQEMIAEIREDVRDLRRLLYER